jgi:hypothetical protein
MKALMTSPGKGSKDRLAVDYKSVVSDRACSPYYEGEDQGRLRVGCGVDSSSVLFAVAVAVAAAVAAVAAVAGDLALIGLGDRLAATRTSLWG